jgi:phage shock protein PspC (stress-responsive transcriptional regulator)
MTSAAPIGPSTSDVPPPATPRLRRGDTDRMIGGVCGGLADYTGIDAVLWRVAFIALTVLGGSGILFYAVLWLLMPAPSAIPDTPLDRGVERLRNAVEDVAQRLHRP